MDRVKDYILKNFESLFILVLLVSVALINYFVYAKLAFLNFYYLPILAAGYYLGKRMAVLGGFFVILMVWIFVLVNETAFMQLGDRFDLYFDLTVWGCFLILSGAMVGGLSEKFRVELQRGRDLSESLSREQALLQDTNKKLSDYSAELEQRVTDRTQELQKSKVMVENLKEKVENALFSVMDSTVARMLVEGNLRDEKRRISVLFSDLKGFTSYSDDHPPERVVGELNAYLNEMEDAILHYFGHIDKYMGDGIMSEFGAPVGYAMHPLMAVLAGLYMQKKIARSHPGWKMRIGVATGPSVIGLFGSRRKSYSCIGDTANLASRLEGLCEPGGLFMDEETYNDVKPFIRAKRVYALYGARTGDEEILKDIQCLSAELAANPQDVEILFKLGQAYFLHREATPAIECFEKVLSLEPTHQDAKLAYAEARMKLDEFEKIAIKGKRRRVAVYQALGVLDPLENRNKFGEDFWRRHGDTPSRIKISEEVIYRIESIDGRIGHGRVVAVLAYAMARELDLSEPELEEILIAGYLHDLGHETIPFDVLESRKKLSEQELRAFHGHPQASAVLIKKMGYESESLLAMVSAHHERFNGSGYPRGLRGEDIPLGARILAVADTFDALTAKRLYAETWEYQSALREIHKDADKGLYDPRCVEALRRLIGC